MRLQAFTNILKRFYTSKISILIRLCNRCNTIGISGENEEVKNWEKRSGASDTAEKGRSGKVLDLSQFEEPKMNVLKPER